MKDIWGGHQTQGVWSVEVGTHTNIRLIEYVYGKYLSNFTFLFDSDLEVGITLMK